MTSIRRIKIDNNTYELRDARGSQLYVGTCSTAAATNPKVCTVEEFPVDENGKPYKGTEIVVKFTATNTSTSTTPELNVNGTGAIRIWYNNAVLASAKSAYAGYANRYLHYVYDGTYWVFMGHSVDNNSTYSNVALGQGYAVQNNSAASATITATLGSYALTDNGIVSVKFLYDVPANATLNINSNGAKAIYNKDAAITSGVIKAGDTATFIYNTYYRLISVDRWQDKQDAISDLATIRSGAGKGATSVQTISVNDASLSPTDGNISISAVTGLQFDGSTHVGDVQLPEYVKKSDYDTTIDDIYQSIPSDLADLADDKNHRLVTEAEKSRWNYKQNAIGDLATIRSGAALGATALQSYTETDPTVPAWAKSATKPSYTASEISGLSTVATSGSYDDLSNTPTIPTSSDINAAKPLVVTLGYSNGAYTCNTSNADIYTAWSNGRDVIAETDSGYIYHLCSTPTLFNVMFSGLMDELGRELYVVTTKSNVQTVTYFYDSIQQNLVSGTNIKTINNQSLLGRGNLTASDIGALPDTTVIPTKTSQLNNDSGFLTSHQDISGKQDTLISGTNIKTINSESILGNGNIITGSKIYVGLCNTQASQSTKVVTTESFPTSGGKPLTGTLIAVFFANTDTSSSSYTYLNVNYTGAIKIMYGSGNFASGKNIRYTGISNVYTIYMYNGTYWRWITTALENLSLSGFGYATQNNSSASSSITATLPNYTQMQGGIVCVKFTYDVPANSSLKINSTSESSIKYKGSNITAGIIKAGDLVTFVYNSVYQILAIDSSYTKAEIDSMIGNIETLLASI